MNPDDKGSYWQPQTDAQAGAGPDPLTSTPLPAPVVPQPIQSAPEPDNRVDQDASQGYDQISDDTGLEWEASEYIHHEKQGMWFAGLYGAALLLLAVSIFVVQSWTFVLLIVVMAVALTVFAIRQPRIMRYRLSPRSIEINDKTFSYRDFRYFGVLQDGPLYSAQLISTKRFIPAVTLYFPGEYGEQIVDMLGSFLPMKQVELDFIDKLSRRLRF